MRSALFWDITQRIVAIPYRRFGKHTGPVSKGEVSKISWPLKTRSIVCTETSARNYHCSLLTSQKSADLISQDLRTPVLRNQVQWAIWCIHKSVAFVSEMASSPLVSALSIPLHQNVKLHRVVMQKIKYLHLFCSFSLDTRQYNGISYVYGVQMNNALRAISCL